MSKRNIERHGIKTSLTNRFPGGVAVVYAPNGTGKSSLANLLNTEESSDILTFSAVDENGNNITPETRAFHVIPDQINRNVIRGKTTDYLIGAQIRREYELKDRIQEGNVLRQKQHNATNIDKCCHE